MEISVGPASAAARGSWVTADYALPTWRYHPVSPGQLLWCRTVAFSQPPVRTENVQVSPSLILLLNVRFPFFKGQPYHALKLLTGVL